jgi:hypothetical protein
VKENEQKDIFILFFYNDYLCMKVKEGEAGDFGSRTCEVFACARNVSEGFPGSSVD